jgi:hypothetical protein
MRASAFYSRSHLGSVSPDFIETEIGRLQWGTAEGRRDGLPVMT